MICRNGEIIRPHVGGVPLGLLEERDYEEVAFQAQSGDVIVFYSDGVQDQTNLTEEEYGRSRLAQLIKQVSPLPAQQIADAILADLEQYKEDGVVADDQTVIVMKVS
jgi:sigma-B regulation protein RsbU (phosphoserine phosphatase)